jgi:integrase/recombinase XerD
MQIRLKYLSCDRDINGNLRFYVRVRGRRKIRIKATPLTQEFMTEYHSALSEIEQDHETKKYRSPAAGSFGHACLALYASANFKALDESTQKRYRGVLDEICKNHGNKPIALIQRKHVLMLRDEKAATPGQAKTLLKALRALFRFTVDRRFLTDDPTLGIEGISYTPKEHHSWTDEEIARFEATHPIGSKPRLALAILLYTCCRREDVTRLGQQHIKNGRLQYTQAKNEKRNPVRIDIPLHPELGAIIAATPSNHLAFITTEYGKPFPRWFRQLVPGTM